MQDHINTLHIKMREFLSDELFEARAARQRYSQTHNRTGEHMSDGEVQAYTKAMRRLDALTLETLEAIKKEQEAELAALRTLQSQNN